MSTAAAVVLGALLAQGPNDAEKLYNDMAARMAKAQTLSVRFTVKLEGDRRGSLQGSVQLAAGNKARVVVAGELNDKPVKVTVLSDGNVQQVRTGDGAPAG